MYAQLTENTFLCNSKFCHKKIQWKFKSITFRQNKKCFNEHFANYLDSAMCPKHCENLIMMCGFAYKNIPKNLVFSEATPVAPSYQSLAK